jgi:hypothetical protein
MIMAKSITEARANCEHLVRGEGCESWVSRFFKATADAPDQPVAFLVDKKPGSVIAPHFHEVNQFQVIVGGYGKLGKQDVKPFTLHYTNGFTGYGPITAEDEGISFFTLRNRLDPGGARFFPEGRSFMKPARKRHRVSAHLVLSDDEALKSRTSEVLETAIELEPDGLAAWFLRAVPGVKTQAPSPADGGGQYLIVARGTLLYDSAAFPELSCVYVPADSESMPLEAGAQGLEVLIAQFPTAEAHVGGQI